MSTMNLIEGRRKTMIIMGDTDQKGQWLKKRRQESYGTIRKRKDYIILRYSIII